MTAAKAVGRRIAPGWTRRAHRSKPMLDCDFEALLVRTAYLMTIVKTRYSRLSLPIDCTVKPCTTGPIIPKRIVGPAIDAQNVTHFLCKRKNCGFCLLFRQISTVRLTLGAPPQRRFSPVRLAMKVPLIPVTPFQQNCSIVVCKATGRAVVVDPGGEAERIISAVQQ